MGPVQNGRGATDATAYRSSQSLFTALPGVTYLHVDILRGFYLVKVFRTSPPQSLSNPSSISIPGSLKMDRTLALCAYLGAKPTNQKKKKHQQTRRDSELYSSNPSLFS